MKNISSKPRSDHAKTQKPSAFTRIMHRGHRKVGFKKSTSDLIMQFSAEDHKRIASVIASWLDKKENSR
ncbi:hypothetical protein N9V74_03515 [Alteromonas sp.]|nr:hypothetical protein [Alteromonas sp.]